MIIAPLLREPTGDLDDPDVNGIVIDPSATTFEGERRCGRQGRLRAAGRVNASPRRNIRGATAFGDLVGPAAYSIIRETSSAYFRAVANPITSKREGIDNTPLEGNSKIFATLVPTWEARAMQCHERP